jgi:hypothetical protein
MNQLIADLAKASRLREYCVGCLQTCGVVAGTSGVLHYCQNEACIRYGLLTVFTTDKPIRVRGISQGLTIATAEEAGRKAYEEATAEGGE